MDELPGLDRLSHSDKDGLFRALFAQVKFLTARVAALTAKVAELEGRFALNSRNSSKPSSTDGLNKPKPKSLRQSEHRTGGQKGHDGHAPKKAARPDHTGTHRPPAHCDACGSPLGGGTVLETRQAFDIPPLRYGVTEHQGVEIRCHCGNEVPPVFRLPKGGCHATSFS